MSVLKAAYPRYYDGKSEKEIKEAVNLWAAMMSDYDYKIVAGAIKALIATSPYPPTVADVNNKIQLLTHPQEMSELEAWSYVLKAIKNSLYSSREEFEKLPEECQTIVCTPEQLRAWAMLDVDEVNTVIASNFQRSFRSTLSKRREYNMLPQQVKNLIESISGGLSMIEEG